MEAKADLVVKDVDECPDESSEVVVSVKDKNAKKKRTRQNIIRTIFDGLLVLFLGMQVSQKGPSFLDLQLISGTDLEGASSYFTANSFGYMVGALIAGFLYDKVGNKMALICLPLTAASFLIGLTPWCTTYVTMLLAHMSSAFGCSIPETTITADQFHIWKGKSESAFQFLSFTYSLGGVLGPLYTEPFLVPKWNKTDNTVHAQDSKNPETNNTSDNPLYLSISSSSSANQTVFDVGFDGNQTHSLSNFKEHPDSQLFYAYMISGFFGILFSIPFYVMFCKQCFRSARHAEKKNEEIEENQPKRLTLKPYVILTAMSCFIFFFYTMTEDSFNMFLSMFVVSHLSWTKENGALISSLYWGIGTISKLISVPVVRKLDLGLILLVSCVGMVISMVVFVLASHYRIDIMIWISSSGFALSQATIFGGCFSWVDTNILKLDGKATSVTMISAGCGAMVGPLVLGITMESFSLMVFPYIELINSVITASLFISMSFILKPYVAKRYGPVRRKADDVNVNFAVNGNSGDTVVDEKKKMVSDDAIKCDNFIIKEGNDEKM